MRQLPRLLILACFTAFIVAACSIDSKGTLTDSPDGSVAADGGGGFGGVSGECFVGAKVCDGKCVSESDPATGCGQGACEPCNAPNAVAKCTGDLCDLGDCQPGFANCNGNTGDGCEVELDTNPLNCGACGNDCTVKGPTWIVCKGGECKQSDCPTGEADCDQDEICETNITNDVNNCKLCGVQCSFANAAASCVNSSCTMGSCDAGYADCNNQDIDGCEINTQTDTDNCGGCNTQCQSTNAVTECKNGKCSPSCANGWGDCDGNPNNGCETPLTTVNDCGACHTKCTAAPAGGTAACQGSCTFTCGGGLTKCGNACRNLTNDVNNCNACGNKCPAAPAGGTAVCQNGSCTFTCGGGLTKCGNACINTSGNDVNNCGGCGTKCTAAPPGGTPACASGSCTFTCGGGLTKCGNACIDTNGSDVNNCGGCGTQCTTTVQNATPACSSGTCTFTCNSGLTKCGNACFDVQTDPNHCGSCPNVCNPAHVETTECKSGSCDYTTCSTGYDDCDSNRTNGCETTLGTDQNCLSCGDQCTGGKHCKSNGCHYN
ncbi:MAG: hypothetical protein KC776_36870 [Myxococcales bacterium]|nr:hypothetical protein [Myxococcales bacterium]MCB9577566.1 hypothetical protein [Polyangiaceae bacterium]